jgi:hypothetical protein
VLRALGDLPGARAAHERALTIREEKLGPNHPKTTISREWFADYTQEDVGPSIS